MKTIFIAAIALPTTILLAACGVSQPQLDAYATQVAAAVFATQTAAAPSGSAQQVQQPAAGNPVPTVEPLSTPPALPASTRTASPGGPQETASPPLAPHALFKKLAPSAAYIKTPGGGTGSGMLLQGGYVVTNAHVVWPYDTVRVVFPDGSEFPEAPVVGWDRMTDLAVVGPLDTPLPGVELVDGEQLATGTPVFLIGYPSSNEDFPKPAMTAGIVSRMREWDPPGLTFIQSDARIAGGQSGGMLATQDGQVIGISGLEWDGFALVASMADQAPRVQQLIAGDKVNEIGARRWPDTGAAKADGPDENGQWTHQIRLEDPWDRRTFVLDQPPNTDVTVEVEGANDLRLAVIGLGGWTLCFANDTATGVESCSLTTGPDGPYLVEIGQDSFGVGQAELHSSHSLTPLEDVDDGSAALVGQRLAANLDYVGDVDFFQLDLDEGETVDIAVDSMNVIPLIRVTFRGASPDEDVYGDGWHDGAWVYGDHVVYRAPSSGRYFVIVGSDEYSYMREGGYYVDVAPAGPDATPQPIKSPTPAPTQAPPILLKGYGPMELYVSEAGPFSLRFPGDWTVEAPPLGFSAFIHGDQGGSLAIQEEDLWLPGWPEQSLGWYVDYTIENLEQALEGFKVLDVSDVSTEDGSRVVILEYSASKGQTLASQLIYLHEGRYGFTATYSAPAQRHQQLKPLIDYSFSTFAVTDSEAS